MNTAKKTSNDNLNDQVERDMVFENRIGQYSKNALTMAITQISQNENTRNFLLNYLEEMEGLMKAARLSGPSLRDSILRAVESERKAQDKLNGPVQMNPRTIGEWTDQLSRLITKASSRANMGQDMAALKLILWVGRDAVAALEDRIDAAADHHKDSLGDAIANVLQHPEDYPAPAVDITEAPREMEAEISAEKTIGEDGILFRGHYYYSSWMAERQGEKVRVKTPSDPHSILVVQSPHIHQVIGEAHRVEKKTADPDATGPAANDSVTENSN